MISKLFPKIGTELDLNGPILSFTSNPVGVATTSGESVTLSGIATVSFGSTANNTGSIAYRWYEVGVGALSDGSKFTGTGTTTLTILNATTPDDNNRKFYLQADYIPSVETGNALNEPLASGIATITVDPLIEIIAQPTDPIATITDDPLIEIIAQPTNSQALVNTNTTFKVNAGLTDDTYGNVTYQWYLDGNAVNDGTITQYEDVIVRTTTTTYQTINQTLYRTRVVNEQRSENRTFDSDGSVTLHPSSYDVIVRVAGAAGGKGGLGGSSGGTSGFGGLGRFGRFFYSNGGRTLKFRIGKKGNDGITSIGSGGGSGGSGGAIGGRGGNVGPAGLSGGGGGGGGATTVYDTTVGGYTIIAAGGGGGGGASFNLPGGNGEIGGGFSGDANVLGPSNGNNGLAGLGTSYVRGFPPRGGGGGGGSGGGAIPGDGGDGGNWPFTGSGGGKITYGAYNRNVINFPNDDDAVINGNGYAQIEWKWINSYTIQEPYTQQVVVPVEVTTETIQSVPRNIVLSGTKTPVLTIREDFKGTNELKCRISSTIATNSPLFTNTVQYSSLSTANQYDVNIESIGSLSTASLSSINLFNGEYEFLANAGDPNNSAFISTYILYCPDRDINVEMDLYGGKGIDVGSNVGGEGGFSRIRFTMERNVEYVISGLIDFINTPFIYRKSTLIACVGSGGDAGSGGKGGFGGGIGIGGQTGFGKGGGLGGSVVSNGTLSANGIFGSRTTLTATAPDTKASTPNGGRVLPCTRGVYWRNQGISACSDVGTTQFRLSDGTIISNTASIERGYKSGYNIIQTSGAKIGNGGKGGNGATGGQGGDNGGGGGGSGYTDGSVTVVDTQLGGSNFTYAKVVLRVVS